MMTVFSAQGACLRSHQFLKLALDCGALRFGSFRLKSGRISPYFFDSGALHTGSALYQSGIFYAQTVRAADIAFDGILGLAYKGISVAAAMALCLERNFDMNVRFSVSRKETKGHGEGGRIMGAPLRGRLVIVDDVITAGTAVNEAMPLVERAGAQAVAIVVAFDREEKGTGRLSAIHEIERRYCLQVISIANVSTLIEWMKNDPQHATRLDALRRYRSRYAA